MRGGLSWPPPQPFHLNIFSLVLRKRKKVSTSLRRVVLFSPKIVRNILRTYKVDTLKMRTIFVELLTRFYDTHRKPVTFIECKSVMIILKVVIPVKLLEFPNLSRGPHLLEFIYRKSHNLLWLSGNYLLFCIINSFPRI